MTKKFYEIALKSPGLKTNVKIDLRLSKKDLLFLARLIDFGLNADLKKDEDILALLPAETKDQLNNIKAEMLKKADLDEWYQEVNQV